MPKRNQKGRSERRRNNGYPNGSDEESLNDNESSYSENRSTEECEETDLSASEQFEEKLYELIDGFTQKSSQGRTNCFQSVTKALVSKYMPTFIRDRYFTICDGIERSLKKGGGPEKIAAAELAIAVYVQLGAEGTSEEIYGLLKPILSVIVFDNSVAAAVRAKCCIALGNITFLSESSEIGDVILLMQQFESIFAESYLKGDGSLPNITSETATLHAAAVSTWSLLLTLVDPGNIGTTIINSKNVPSLQKFSELLYSAHLDVRMAAGEALALIYELGREDDAEFEDDFALDLLDILKQLATDSHKHRTKKDRKVQRATFRDILQFIENDATPDIQVKFNKEVLVLDTWTKRKHYETLCSILGPGINIHLAENYLLRDIFELSEPPSTEILQNSQVQRKGWRKNMMNAANFKARTLSRAKNRDKRSDF